MIRDEIFNNFFDLAFAVFMEVPTAFRCNLVNFNHAVDKAFKDFMSD